MTQRTFTTPDGRLRVDFNEFPMRMSHIVCNPRVIFVPTGEVVLDLFDTLWDGSGDDWLYGDAGDDTLYDVSGPGNDHANGGTGYDLCWAEVKSQCEN